MMKKRELVSFDWAMKRLLRQPANYVILEGFFSELLREDIKIVNFEDSESNKNSASDKFNRVDLLVRNSKQELMLVEVQYDSEIDYFQRMLFGSSKLVCGYFNEGESYKKIKKVISINLVYFDLGQGKDYLYHGKTDFHGLHCQDILSLSPTQKQQFSVDYPSELYPEYYIIKLNSFDDYARDTLDEWIYMLKNSKLPENYKAQGLKEADETLRVINMTDSQRRDHENFLKEKSILASTLGDALNQISVAERKIKELNREQETLEADKQKAEADKQKAEADKQKAEDQAEGVLKIALEALIKAGVDPVLARAQLGI